MGRTATTLGRLGRSFGALGLVLLLAGCGGMRIEDYEGRTPRFVPEEWFAGRTVASGFFAGRFNGLHRPFTVDIDGRVEDGALILDERFRYADGEVDRRVWTLRQTAPGRYEGTAADVIGTATGRTAGNAFHWSYVLALEVDGRTWHLDVEDWMWLQEDGTLLNKATFSKFGIRVGEVFLAFRKAGAAGALEEPGALGGSGQPEPLSPAGAAAPRSGG